jgi:hypothetical protein
MVSDHVVQGCLVKSSLEFGGQGGFSLRNWRVQGIITGPLKTRPKAEDHHGTQTEEILIDIKMFGTVYTMVHDSSGRVTASICSQL